MSDNLSTYAKCCLVKDLSQGSSLRWVQKSPHSVFFLGRGTRQAIDGVQQYRQKSTTEQGQMQKKGRKHKPENKQGSRRKTADCQVESCKHFSQLI